MKGQKLLWLDLEMTGLNVQTDKIIEIATLLTDYDLEPLSGSAFHRVLSCDESILAGMNEWCTTTHKNVCFPSLEDIAHTHADADCSLA